jgi:hypothetical protein
VYFPENFLDPVVETKFQHQFRRHLVARLAPTEAAAHSSSSKMAIQYKINNIYVVSQGNLYT